MPKYAYFNTAATTNPQQVLGWYDTDDFTYPNLPAAAALFALTPAQWNGRLATPYLDTSTTPYSLTATAPLLTLAQAQAAQIAAINQQYNIHINAGFVSTALGAPHTYPLNLSQLAGRTTESHAHKLAAPWTASAPVVVGNWIGMAGNLYQCTVAGTTGVLAPIWPTTLGTTVIDGTATWKFYDTWAGSFMCADALGNAAITPHTQDQFLQVGIDSKQNVDAIISHQQSLVAQVNAATTVTAVQAVPTW